MTSEEKRFGTWLRRRREGAGLSLEGLGAKLGQGRASIDKYEDRDDPPAIDTLVSLCNALGTTIIEPLTELGYLPSRLSLQAQGPEESALLSQFRNFSSREQRLAVAIFKAIRDTTHGGGEGYVSVTPIKAGKQQKKRIRRKE